jgi:hypothetical protein
MAVFRSRAGGRSGLGAAGREQRYGKNCECYRDGSFVHSSLHLVRDNSNGTGSGFVIRRFLSTTLSAVLLSLRIKLIPFFEESNNQSSDARKISKTEGG